MSDNRLILDIHADYEIAPHMVVFSHGFGVERTNRGLFTDLVRTLPEDYGYVLFDYYDITGKTVNFSSLQDQQRMLLSIIAWLSEQADVTDISLVAHSMGCIVAALAQPPELKQVVMLAPPLMIGDGPRAYFTGKDGAEKRDNLWVVPQGEGITNYIPEKLFDEFETVKPQEALLDYAAVQPFELLIPTDDEVLGTVDYNDLALDENITALTIDEADHNFSGVSRHAVIAAVLAWLQPSSI